MKKIYQSEDSHESSDSKGILKDKQDNIRCTKEKRRSRKHSEMRENRSASKEKKKSDWQQAICNYQTSEKQQNLFLNVAKMTGYSYGRKKILDHPHQTTHKN